MRYDETHDDSVPCQGFQSCGMRARPWLVTGVIKVYFCDCGNYASHFGLLMQKLLYHRPRSEFLSAAARAWLPDTSLISSALLFFRDPFAIAVFYGFLALQVGARVIENDFGTTQSNPEPTVTLELSSGKRSRFTLALHRRLKKKSQHAPGRNCGLECCESSIANFPSFSRAAHRTIMVES